jgi:hypothetical protein
VSADERVAAIVAKTLLDEGCQPGSSIHSWRCEHPDRYGECTCVSEVAEEVAAALGPVLAEVRAEALREAADDLFAKAVTLRKHADACDADGLPSSAMADRLHASRIADFGDWLLDRIGGTP